MKLGAYRNSSVHNIWRTMIARCHNPRSKDFKDYGGRGIQVCSSWRKSFWNFLKDMGEPKPGMSLDRKNNAGNYEKSNCVWATRLQQAANTRRNRMLVIDGIERHMAGWCRYYRIKITTVKYRLDKLRWSAAKALKTPVTNGTYGDKN